jgi:hypothetical protein
MNDPTPGVIHRLSTTLSHTKVIHRLSYHLYTGKDHTKDPCNDLAKDRLSEPNQRHKDSDDSEAYSDSDIVSSEVVTRSVIAVRFIYSIDQDIQR